MKSKVTQIFVTLTISSVALIAIIICYLCRSICFMDLVLNIFYGVFGSGVLAFVISIIEYYNVKRQTINDFYDEYSDFLELIHKISFMDVTELEETTAKYISLQSLFDEDEKERRAFCIETKKELAKAGINVDEKNVIMFLKLESDSFKKRLTESMLSYINVSKYNIKRLFRLSNSIYFINNKYKKHSHLYDEVETLYRLISSKSLLFEDHIKSNAGNVYQMVEFIKELNKQIFRIEKSPNHKVAWDEKYHSLSNKLICFYNLVMKNKKQTKEDKPIYESANNLVSNKQDGV